MDEMIHISHFVIDIRHTHTHSHISTFNSHRKQMVQLGQFEGMVQLIKRVLLYLTRTFNEHGNFFFLVIILRYFKVGQRQGQEELLTPPLGVAAGDGREDSTVYSAVGHGDVSCWTCLRWMV